MASLAAAPIKPKKVLRDSGKLVALAALLYFVPVLTLVYLACGVLDFTRNRVFSYFAINRYFFGNGLLTWLVSPFNLVIDLLCARNPGIHRLDDLPEDCVRELRTVFAALQDKKDEIAAAFKQNLETSRRTMLFFRWYDRDIAGPVSIDIFPARFAYVKTIGISCFNTRESTSWHFGPTRVTFRVLYNLEPPDSADAYIQVGAKTHYWRDDPLFIFDDTLLHRSVNDTDELRYCAFIDILRPSRFHAVLQAILGALQVVFLGVNRLFYRNWVMLK